MRSQYDVSSADENVFKFYFIFPQVFFFRNMNERHIYFLLRLYKYSISIVIHPVSLEVLNKRSYLINIFGVYLMKVFT